MKRLLAILVLLIFSVIITWGCTDQNPTVNNYSQDKILSIYNWSSYIEPEIIREFENRFKVKINYETFESNDELYQELKSGKHSYDLVFPSDYMVAILSKEGFLEELNLKNIPNLKHIDKKFLKTYFDLKNQYSLPYQWGTIGIGFNMKNTSSIKSWQEVFNLKNQNKIALIDESRSMLGIILLYLGYDPNTTKPDEIEQAKNFLIQHQEAIESFTEKSHILLLQGIVDIAVVWSGDLLQYQKVNSNLRYVIPQESSIIWIDNIAIAKNAPNKALAEKFINFVFEPKISAKIAERTKYGSPNKTSISQKLINSEDLNNSAIYPPPEVLNRLTYLQDLGTATKLYDRAWQEVKMRVDKL